MISASKLDLAKQCAWWARPDVPRAPYVPSKAADEGTALHAEVEAFLRDGVAGTSELFAVWRAQWWSGVPQTSDVVQWLPELQVAMGPPAAGKAQLGHPGRTGRDYRWIPRGWVSGTADAVRVYEHDGERIVHVVDWKTGRADYVTPIAANGQMRFLAAALASALGATRATIELAFVHLEGVQTERAELDVFDLADIRAELRELLDRVPDAEPSPGPWCRGKFCGAYGTTCPATTASARALVEVPAAPFAVALTVEDIESDAHATWLYHSARQAQARMGAIWEALRQRASIHPIPVSEGRVYALRESQRETIDATVSGAVDVLRRHLGERWESAVKYQTSKAAISSAVSEAKAAGADVKVGALSAAILEDLRAVGAVKVTTSSTADERAG